MKNRLLIEINLYVLLAALGAAYIYFGQTRIMDETLSEIRTGGEQTERVVILNRGSLSLAQSALAESKTNAANTLRETQAQSSAMRGAVDATIDAERPWVGIDKIEAPGFGPGKTNKITVTMRNGGRSVADVFFVQEIGSGIFQQFPENPPYRGGVFPGSRVFLLPNDTFKFESNDYISEPDFQTLRSGAATFRVYAHFKYRDVRTKKEYFVKICNQFIPNRPTNEEFWGCKEYADAN